MFRLAPPPAGESLWTETMLYRFRFGRDDANPRAGLIADANGVLYGTTPFGGRTGCSFRCGTVLRVVP